MNYGGLRNDHSETPAHLSKEDSIISKVQQISCIAGAPKIRYLMHAVAR